MDTSSVCFTPGALALLAAIGGVIQATIIALFIALQRSHAATEKAKDNHLQREQDQNADLWDVLKPSIGIANHALDAKARRESPRRAGT